MSATSLTDKIRHPHTRLLGHFAAILAVLTWGYSFVSSKVLLEHGLGPVKIYLLRFALAYVLILLFSHKRLFSYNWRDEFLLALCGFTAGSLYFIAENTALQYTLPTNVSLLTSLSPLLTAFLVAALYKSVKVGAGTWVGSVMAVIGTVCVVFNSATEIQVYPVGDILSLGAAMSWAVYSLILKKIDAGYDVWFISRKTFFYGLLTALPFLPFDTPSSLPLLTILSDRSVLGNLLFLGLGASTMAYLLWAYSVRSIGAVSANNYMYFQSVVTLVVAAIVLGDKITLMGIIGTVLILGGLVCGDKLNEYLEARKTTR